MSNPNGDSIVGLAGATRGINARNSPDVSVVRGAPGSGTRGPEMTPTPKHPGGRPSTGLTESAKLVRGPRWLLDAAREAARREGLTAAEWWRRAGRMALAASFPELLRRPGT
jgi:hypothetical protein